VEVCHVLEGDDGVGVGVIGHVHNRSRTDHRVERDLVHGKPAFREVDRSVHVGAAVLNRPGEGVSSTGRHAHVRAS